MLTRAVPRLAFSPGSRWINPLIGWTSTADPYAHVLSSALAFNSREAAEAYCRKFGFQYEVNALLSVPSHPSLPASRQPEPEPPLAPDRRLLVSPLARRLSR